jgi:hypothetical protein
MKYYHTNNGSQSTTVELTWVVYHVAEPTLLAAVTMPTYAKNTEIIFNKYFHLHILRLDFFFSVIKYVWVHCVPFFLGGHLLEVYDGKNTIRENYCPLFLYGTQYLALINAFLTCRVYPIFSSGICGDYYVKFQISHSISALSKPNAKQLNPVN